MKLKDLFEIFGSSPLSEMIYLFTLIIVWIEFVLPIAEPNSFKSYFLATILVLFVISRIGIVFFEVFKEEKK